MSARSEACSTMLKALADDTRLRVVRSLMDGPKHVNEINAQVRCDQSLLSHHLKVLRDAKLVTSVRDGKAVLYSLAGARARQSVLDLGCCKLSFD